MLSSMVNMTMALAIQAAPGATAPIVTAPVANAPAPVVVWAQPRVVTPAVPPAVRARALTSLPTLFSTADYPVAALRLEQQGTTAVALAVNREGRITACDVTSSSGSAALDQTTCAILQRRARFTPARDARGKVVDDTSTARIRWALPPAMPLAFADRFLRLIVTMDAAGKPTGCRGEQKPDGPPPPSPVCELGKSIALRILADQGSSVGARNADFILENGLNLGGSEALLKIGNGAGERLIGLSALALEIDPSGLVTKCENADGFSEVRDVAMACSGIAKRRFAAAPTGGVRRALQYNASYWRPRR